MRANSWRSSFSLPVMYDNKAPHSHGEKRAMSSVLQQNTVEKRVLGMSKTREEALASIQRRLVCLQDSLKWKTEPLDYNTRQSQEIDTMRTLLAITYEFLPDEIALQIKATLDLLERGVPTGV